MTGLTADYIRRATIEAARQIAPWELSDRDRTYGKHKMQEWQAEDVVWYPHRCRAQQDYAHDETGPAVIAGNWNGPVMERAARLYEDMGLEIAWNDETTHCEECGGAIDTSPHSYSHRPEYVIIGDGPVCQTCLLDDDDLTGSYLDEMANDPNRAVMYHFSEETLEAHGWQRQRPTDSVIRDYETGWHPGQDDDPRKVYQELRDRLGDGPDVLFRIDEPSQFYTRWSVWLRDPDAE